MEVRASTSFLVHVSCMRDVFSPVLFERDLQGFTPLGLGQGALAGVMSQDQVRGGLTQIWTKAAQRRDLTSQLTRVPARHVGEHRDDLVGTGGDVIEDTARALACFDF